MVAKYITRGQHSLTYHSAIVCRQSCKVLWREITRQKWSQFTVISAQNRKMECSLVYRIGPRTFSSWLPSNPARIRIIYCSQMCTRYKLSLLLSHVCVTIDGVSIGNWIYWTLTEETIALSLIYTLYNPLQHALNLFSLQCLHQSLSGNGFQLCSFLRYHVHALIDRRLSPNSQAGGHLAPTSYSSTPTD
jgi:hypothetical protein